MTIRERVILGGAVLMVLASASVWTTHWMTQQRQNATNAAGDLTDCRELARTIESLRSRPTVASTEDMGVEKLGQCIESALAQAQLKGLALEGVFPQPSRRVGQSSYLLKPTSLMLRGVTLGQLVTFLYHISDGSGLSVRELVLRSPRGNAPHDSWDADVTLAYLIYLPPKESGS